MEQKKLSKTKGIKKWLKDNGHTEEELQAEWDKIVELNPTGLIGWCIKNGYDWHYLNLHLIGQLFGYADIIIEKREKEKLEEEEKAKKEIEKQYYEDHFEEIMFNNIISNKELTEKELQRLVDEYEIDRSYGDNRRWNRRVQSIIKLCDRYFCIVWDQGLTENQEDCFDDQPYEVKPHEYEKVITVKEWQKI